LPEGLNFFPLRVKLGQVQSRTECIPQLSHQLSWTLFKLALFVSMALSNLTESFSALAFTTTALVIPPLVRLMCNLMPLTLDFCVKTLAPLISSIFFSIALDFSWSSSSCEVVAAISFSRAVIRVISPASGLLWDLS
jgi:hypothetical protein